MTASVGSVTVPVRVPVRTWEKAVAEVNNDRNATRSRQVHARPPRCDLCMVTPFRSKRPWHGRMTGRHPSLVVLREDWRYYTAKPGGIQRSRPKLTLL